MSSTERLWIPVGTGSRQNVEKIRIQGRRRATYRVHGHNNLNHALILRSRVRVNFFVDSTTLVWNHAKTPSAEPDKIISWYENHIHKHKHKARRLWAVFLYLSFLQKWKFLDLDKLYLISGRPEPLECWRPANVMRSQSAALRLLRSHLRPSEPDSTSDPPKLLALATTR